MYATVHWFIAGKRVVSMEALEPLCDYLGLELRPLNSRRIALMCSGLGTGCRRLAQAKSLLPFAPLHVCDS
jgi:hypothetical protein